MRASVEPSFISLHPFDAAYISPRDTPTLAESTNMIPSPILSRLAHSYILIRHGIVTYWRAVAQIRGRAVRRNFMGTYSRLTG